MHFKQENWVSGKCASPEISSRTGRSESAPHSISVGAGGGLPAPQMLVTSRTQTRKTEPAQDSTTVQSPDFKRDNSTV